MMTKAEQREKFPVSEAGKVERELAMAKEYGLYPVGGFWFDPMDNTLCRFDGEVMTEQCCLDDSVRDILMRPNVNYTWTDCTDVRCGLSREEHHERACEEDDDYPNRQWDLLHEPYMAWVKAEGLPEGSAEDLLAGPNLTEDQRSWLEAFIVLWEATK